MNPSPNWLIIHIMLSRGGERAVEVLWCATVAPFPRACPVGPVTVAFAGPSSSVAADQLQIGC